MAPRTDLRGLSGDTRATSKGRPGDDIEQKRKEQKARTWDAALKVAMSRQYESWAHAKKGVAKGG